MARLVDYFAIIGYNHDKDRNGSSFGKIIQRFPEEDWSDSPFIKELEVFCQPQGWRLSTERQEPQFFMSVFTNDDANLHYCAVLCFNEPVSLTPTKPADEEEDSLILRNSCHLNGDISPLPSPAFITHHTIKYAPKCLVLISTLDYFETFRNCLGIIYTVYMEGPGVSMESLVGNMVGYVRVPPPGGPQVRFSIGAGDRQAVQPPSSPTIPVTNTVIYFLFTQLALTEHKVLFLSRSYTHLTNACQALKALLFPFRYQHVYIPLLPASLVDFLATPTPFIMGVHASLQCNVADYMDVIIADLDGGSIRIPVSVNVSLLPDPFWYHIMNALSMVLHPDICIADSAFQPVVPPKSSPPGVADKEIRAVFMRMFAHLFQGYRSCLNASFLGQRGMVDNEFVCKLLDCMSFNTFISERGLPWRVCDLWDDLYSYLSDHLRQERYDNKKLLVHIQELAERLYDNENPSIPAFVSNIPKPTEGCFTRIHQPVFPYINPKKVQEIINEGNKKKVLFQLKSSQCTIVPVGPHVTNFSVGHSVTSSTRRLEVMKNCITCIFENKISDARKTFPAVLKALRSKAARLALCTELSQHVQGNKAVLEHQQFDLVVRLMNCALQNDSPLDEHGVAAALLPLSTVFCRKLCTGVIQFAYTCIQDHAVWSKQQFWESAFYQDVEKDIKSLYLSSPDIPSNGLQRFSYGSSRVSALVSSAEKSENNLRKERSSDSLWRDKCFSYLNSSNISALDIMADQLRLLPNIDASKLKELEMQEEGTVFSQAIHYVHRMVYLLVPLDVGVSSHKRAFNDKDSTSISITNSIAGSDSIDVNCGFEDQEQSKCENNIIKIISRFVDKVCSEGGVSEDHIKSLHEMIPSFVAVQIETLDSVYRESKRLPPIQKPRILLPSLVPGEEVVSVDHLRVYLLPDGRDEFIGGNSGGTALLPAEGALFLTNYRIIFKGLPTDPYACEQIVLRSFPVSSITREKRFSVTQHPGEQWQSEGFQIRSNTFQLIKVAFDKEVSSESIEILRKAINRLRHPPAINSVFAFTGTAHVPQILNHREKDKTGYGTLRGFAKKTLLKTAKVTGIKPSKGGRRTKYIFPNGTAKHMNYSNRKMMTLPQLTVGDGGGNDEVSFPDDDLSSIPLNCQLLHYSAYMSRSMEGLHETGKRGFYPIVDELELANGTPINQIHYGMVSKEIDSKTLERLTDRSYYKDYQRLGLGLLAINSSSHSRSKSEFRISSCNSHYQLCRSYPALLCVPSVVSDESLNRLARIHRNNRFPIITWRHPRSRGLLLRGAGLHGKGVIIMGSTSEPSHNVEHEKIFQAIINATPLSFVKGGPSLLNDSTLSVDSLVLATDSLYHSSYSTLTPDTARKSTTSAFSKAISTLKISSSFHPRHSADFTDVDCIQSFQKASLYVFVEKAVFKGIKTELYSKTEFIPVEYPEVRQIRSSFKKLMRACVPSSVSSDQELSFLKDVENSEWINYLSVLLQCSGAVVDLIDSLGASVMLLLEDGWDFIAQVSSLAQLCLDPFYRTIEGFQALLEKEWLAFGHRFCHRSNLFQTSQSGLFAPIFLQFLDAVHQVQRQFPLSFEFNEYYLKFLAYHSVSCRFRTFLCDCEAERSELGIMTEEDKRGSLSRHHKGLESDEDGFPLGVRFSPSGSTQSFGQSVFDYISKITSRSSVFYNFLYVGGDRINDLQVLRPVHHISSLSLWSYFIGEELRHGPSYDPEVRLLDHQQEEEAEATEGTSSASRRKVVVNGYDNIISSQCDYFTAQLEELHHLELELGYLPQKWSFQWDKLELPLSEQLIRQVSVTTQMVRNHGRNVHKRSTLELLVRAKKIGTEAPQDMYSHPHRFEKYNYTTPSRCDHCSSMLWGPLMTGSRCIDCGYNCHEKCIEHIPKNCTQYKSVRDSSSNIQNNVLPPNLDTTSVGSGVTSHQTSSQQYYDQFASNVAENRTHEGYLWKRGSLLKNWKQRWFVLDSMKHQLRYYDSMEDSHCKGVIELSDVVSVVLGTPSPGAPKKIDERAFFDLNTKRRLYNFCATDGHAAQEWIEKIQSCLQ